MENKIEWGGKKSWREIAEELSIANKSSTAPLPILPPHIPFSPTLLPITGAADIRRYNNWKAIAKQIVSEEEAISASLLQLDEKSIKFLVGISPIAEPLVGAENVSLEIPQKHNIFKQASEIVDISRDEEREQGVAQNVMILKILEVFKSIKDTPLREVDLIVVSSEIDRLDELWSYRGNIPPRRDKIDRNNDKKKVKNIPKSSSSPSKEHVKNSNQKSRCTIS